MTNSKIIQTLKQFNKTNILVIGDIMLDKYITGEVTRISPEAPIPILKISKTDFTLGGASNVANNLQTLGANVFLSGVIGKDQAGKNLIKKLKKIGINGDGVFIDKNRATTEKTRISAQHQQILRIDKEDTSPINKQTTTKIIEFAKNKIKNIDIIIISDYNKGVVTQELCNDLYQISKDGGIKILADPKGKNYQKYFGFDFITPNLKEISDVTSIENISNSKLLTDSIKKIKGEFKIKNLIVTASEKGMYLFDYKNNYRHFPAIDVEVVDVSGAGDTAISALALSISSKININLAIRIAILAASISIQKEGTATITQKEILDFIKKNEKEFLQ